ncbi:MAG: hypothetical protein PGN11_04990 [Quadrisphaera sp.]
MIPWDLLDFPVLVPHERLGLLCRSRETETETDGQSGEGRDDVVLPHLVVEVDVAVGGVSAWEPDWVVTTRPRRGLRLLDAQVPGPLSCDIDLEGAAGDAVRQLLVMTLPDGLSAPALHALLAREMQEGDAIGAALRTSPGADDPWTREVARVGDDHFAVWVHRRDRGWAAAFDVGWATVTAWGVVEPAVWDFMALPPDRAVEVVRRR